MSGDTGGKSSFQAFPHIEKDFGYILIFIKGSEIVIDAEFIGI